MWFYALNGQTLGPISEADLDAQVRGGTLSPDTYVWRDGMAEWLPYKDCRAAAGLRIERAEQPAAESATELVEAAAIPQGAALRLESGGSWAMLAVMLIAMFGFIGVLSSRPQMGDRPFPSMADADDDDSEEFAASGRLRRGTLTIRNSGGMDWPETRIAFKSSGSTYTYQVDGLERGKSLTIPLTKFATRDGAAYESKLTVPEPSEFDLNVNGQGTATLELSRGRR